MHVTVQYLAQMKRILGRSEDRVELPAGATLADLIRAVVGLGDRDNRSLLFFVNDKPADPATALPEGANVTVLAPMAGG
jgi:molybdopterin converting factor small subunit